MILYIAMIKLESISGIAHAFNPMKGSAYSSQDINKKNQRKVY